MVPDDRSYGVLLEAQGAAWSCESVNRSTGGPSFEGLDSSAQFYFIES